ncbi:hypothetical protein SBA3_2320013 [Candidatus Sulfopaludibacter sp. SbA3]|nr:hypothetical protein SBA3_2320013 [Candidatus Sulfopaludibacter sp. SbA3]
MLRTLAMANLEAEPLLTVGDYTERWFPWTVFPGIGLASAFVPPDSRTQGDLSVPIRNGCSGIPVTEH